MSFNPFVSNTVPTVVLPSNTNSVTTSNQVTTENSVLSPNTTEVINSTKSFQVTEQEIINEVNIENIPIVFWKDKKSRIFAPYAKALKNYFIMVDNLEDDKGLRLKKPAVCEMIIAKMLKDLEATSVKGLNPTYIDSIWKALGLTEWKMRDNIRKERENINYHKLTFDFDALKEFEDTTELSENN